MRKIKAVMVAAVLFATVGVFANEGIKDLPAKSLTNQIYEMLKQNQFDVESDELTAEVRIIINAKGEMVVLSVETNSEALERFVKSRLNYQKVNLNEVESGTVYAVPVRITE